MNLSEFMQTEDLKNSWIAGGLLELYVRKGHHIIDESEELVQCLDIANVRSEHTGMAVMFAAKKWLDHAEQLADELGLTIYVENVLNVQLLAYLQMRGYKRVPNSLDESPCFVRTKE